MAFGAVVEGLLDAGRVEFLLVGFGEGGVELGVEGGAGRWEGGLSDGSGVLCVECSRDGECSEQDESTDGRLLSGLTTGSYDGETELWLSSLG